MANQKLTSSRFNLAEFKRNVFRAQPEAGTKPEALLDPVYWSHVAVNLKMWDRIEVVPENGAWFAELIVIGNSPAGLVVHPLTLVDLTSKAQLHASDEAEEETVKDGDPVAPKGFSYKWMGPAGKYSVFRDADKKVIADKIPSKVALAEFFASMTKQAA